jgi:hypothetical protein
MSIDYKKTIKFIYLQAIWFAIVYYGPDHPYLCLLFGGGLTLLIDFRYYYKKNFLSYFMQVLVLLLLGLIHDQLLHHLEVIIIKGNTLWMLTMWMMFAAYYHDFFRYLYDRKVLSLLFGLIGGPLAYYSGMNLGGLEMPSVFLALPAISLLWSFIFPLTLITAKKFNSVP